MCASRDYTLDSGPNEANKEDGIKFTRALPRRVGAEQVLDAVHRALGGTPQFEGYKNPMHAAQLPGIQAIYRPKKPTQGDKFLHLFGKPPRLLNTDTERVNETSLAQVFELTSGATLNTLLTAPTNTLTLLMEQSDSEDTLISALYWPILTREPSDIERTATREYMRRTNDRRAALEDLAWALLNAKEFLLRI